MLLTLIGCTTTFKNMSDDTGKISSDARTRGKPLGTEPSLENAEDSIGNFPIVRNEDVEKWIVYFQTTAHRSFIQWMQRGEPFKLAIEEALENEGVPSTLYYLALIESGFVYSALSTAKASGPWQFLRDTGRQYGLKSNHWIDQRRDPVLSTHAAAAYLRDLRSKFGDWYLTVAAYNGGPKTIQDAVKKAGTNDFWKLKKAGLLKKETGEFVPKVIAAVILGSDPLKFGFPAKIVSTHSDLPKTVIKIKRPVKLQEIAKKLSLPLAKLKEWNPELLRGMTPPQRYNKDGYYALRVSQEHVEKFAKVESQLHHPAIKDLESHRIAKGDTLDNLAKRYHVSVKTLLQLNPHVHARKIKIGTEIVIPVSETHS